MTNTQLIIPPPPNTIDLSSTIVLNPDLRHVELDIEKHLKEELEIKLDTDQQICPHHLAYLSSLNQSISSINQTPCQLASACPFRHVTPSQLNFNPKFNPPTSNQHQQHHHHSSHSKTVCKHWLRGLCKKGNSCEFLHEYNLRTMPECWFFGKYGFCSNGDECMYLHVDERMRVLECMDFRRGFCPKGPKCSQKHIRRPLCKLYLAGFCPYEKMCSLGGHPKFEVDPTPRGNPYINSFNPFDRPRGDPDRGAVTNPSSNGLLMNNSIIQKLKHASQTGPIHLQNPQQSSNNNLLNPQLIQHQIDLKTSSLLNHPIPISSLIPSSSNNSNNNNNNNPSAENLPHDDNWVQTDAGPRKKRNLDEVTCFKCGQRGHYANTCPNPMVPGNRGGIVRGPGGRLLGDDDLLPVH